VPQHGWATGIGVFAVSTLTLAVAIAFERRRAYAIALACGLAMLALLVWNSGGLNYYPSTGWELFADPIELLSILVLSVLFALLVPLQVAAVAKAPAAFGAAGGLAGTLVAVATVSCCAPLLLPALPSFIGFWALRYWDSTRRCEAWPARSRLRVQR
jgi:hypothetical protein